MNPVRNSKDKSKDSDKDNTTKAGISNGMKQDIEEAILFAKKYLEDLLSFFGLNTDVYATTEDHEVIELDIPSTHLNGFLIGHNGDTLRALQYLISMALHNSQYAHTRINIDVAGYKAHRAERLAKQAEDWFREVQGSGQPKELSPMNPADRRVIHKAADEWGLATESVGVGRERHVVLKPSADGAKDNAKEPKDNKALEYKTKVLD